MLDVMGDSRLGLLPGKGPETDTPTRATQRTTTSREIVGDLPVRATSLRGFMRGPAHTTEGLLHTGAWISLTLSVGTPHPLQ